MSQTLPKILVIVGPTSSGKSDLAVILAKKFSGEIVSADSRQVYMGLDIGTGKITNEEMSGIPHHLLDVADPSEIFTASDYCTLANKSICEILLTNKLPIICGGTGFYIQALVDGISLPNVPPNPHLRQSLSSFSTTALFEKLIELDPDFASIIDRHNPHRLIRAIEIATELGQVPKLQKNAIYDPCFIGITTDIYTLRERIHIRLLTRINAGMVCEAESQHKSGLSYERMETLGLEYRYLARFLQDKLTLDEMTNQLENEIFHYAKRQLTWFKRDSRIHWFDKDDLSSIEEVVKKHIT